MYYAQTILYICIVYLNESLTLYSTLFDACLFACFIPFWFRVVCGERTECYVICFSVCVRVCCDCAHEWYFFFTLFASTYSFVLNVCMLTAGDIDVVVVAVGAGWFMNALWNPVLCVYVCLASCAFVCMAGAHKILHYTQTHREIRIQESLAELCIAAHTRTVWEAIHNTGM